MTNEQHTDHATEAITLGQFFEELTDHVADTAGPGDLEAGWERLQKTLAERPGPIKLWPFPPLRWPSVPVHRLTHATRRVAGMVARPHHAAAVLCAELRNKILLISWVMLTCMVTLVLILSRGGDFAVIGIATGFLSTGIWFDYSSTSKYRRRALLQRKEREAQTAIRRRIGAERIEQRHAVARIQASHAAEKSPEEVFDNRSGTVDLTAADLRCVPLLRLDLIGAHLARANMEGCGLRAANLYGADLSHTNLFSADLSRAELTGATLAGANLSGANLIGARMAGVNLSGTHMIGANLSGAILSRAELAGANLSCTMLDGTDFSGADLSGAVLIGAHLVGAHLHGTNLSDADISKANMRRTYLYRADLSRADLSETNLQDAVLKYAVLVGANLSKTFIPSFDGMNDVIWSEKTCWGVHIDSVRKLSVPIGAGRWRLNPSDGTTPTFHIPLLPSMV